MSKFQNFYHLSIFLLLYFLFLSGCSFLQYAKVVIPLSELKWIFVPGGTFMMGDFEDQTNEDALPLHEVDLPSFYINTYEITYEQYDKYAEMKGLSKPDDEGFGREERAVVLVTWEEAKAFCDCYGARLPAEAEWEYAARDGGKDILYYGTNYKHRINEYIRHETNSVGYSYYVGSKKPNGLGLYDMGGNVYEWIGDFYPQYPDSGKAPEWADYSSYDLRIVRGGSFWSPPWPVFQRIGMLYDEPYSQTGFRCVKLVE